METGYKIANITSSKLYGLIIPCVHETGGSSFGAVDDIFSRHHMHYWAHCGILGVHNKNIIYPQVI